MPEKKKEQKQPLDMTTEEMADYLFPKKVVDRLNEVAGKVPPPEGDDEGSKASSKPSRKHDTT
jgi:hypothetical protein